MADLVIWPSASFGIRPFLVIKGGFVTWSTTGDGNGSIFMTKPMVQRPMWGALGRAKNALSATFVSQLAIDNAVQRKLDVQKPMLPITSVRRLGKKDMLHNDALPVITVDARSFDVRADGKLLQAEPATPVPLCRKYLLR
jgi:urease subunit alpha